MYKEALRPFSALTPRYVKAQIFNHHFYFIHIKSSYFVNNHKILIIVKQKYNSLR